MMHAIDIEKSKKLVSDLLLKLQLNQANFESDDAVNVLKFLWEQTNILFDRVQLSNKNEGRNGQDYFDGVELGNLAQKLAGAFAGCSDEMCELALRIRLKAILQVQSHYHHIIGPSMLSHAEVLERLGREQEAIGNYDCVISDFSWLIDDYTGNDDIPNEEDYISLGSLLFALERTDLIANSETNRDLSRQVKSILARCKSG